MIISQTTELGNIEDFDYTYLNYHRDATTSEAFYKYCDWLIEQREAGYDADDFNFNDGDVITPSDIGMQFFRYVFFDRPDRFACYEAWYFGTKPELDSPSETRFEYVVDMLAEDEPEAILFDTGGVLHEYHRQDVYDDIAKLTGGHNSAEQIFSELLPLFGSGKINEAEFWDEARSRFSIRQVTPEEDFFGRGLEAKFRPYMYTRRLVEALGERGITLAMITNTIEPHARKLEELGLFEGFNERFFSQKIRIRKPERGFYEYVLESLGLSPDKVSYLDDDRESVTAARSLGIHSYLYWAEEGYVR